MFRKVGRYSKLTATFWRFSFPPSIPPKPFNIWVNAIFLSPSNINKAPPPFLCINAKAGISGLFAHARRNGSATGFHARPARARWLRIGF